MQIKPLKKYKKYAVSDTGVVFRIIDKSGNKIKPKRLSPRKDRDGYLQVNLSVNGKLITCKIHRLVALTFLGSGGKKNTVNHIDGNKTNNNLSNLEWLTRKKNLQLTKGMVKKKTSKRTRELQVRIQKAISYIREIETLMSVEQVDSLINILRGKK